jgi:hypothetical protein
VDSGIVATKLLHVPSKKERLKILLDRLNAAPPASSADDALELLSNILMAVENEFSGIRHEEDPDGIERMGPPKEDNRRGVPGRPSLRRYRSAKHNTFIGENGSIRIEDLHQNILHDKAGGDGKRAYDLDSNADGALVP